MTLLLYILCCVVYAEEVGLEPTHPFKDSRISSAVPIDRLGLFFHLCSTEIDSLVL